MIGNRRKADCVAVRTALDTHGRVHLRVYGGSMLPWIRPRDIVVIRHAKLAHIQCGDIVLFAREERLFVHRVIEKKTGQNATLLVTKGDAQPHRDAPISSDELLGRVSSLYRGWHWVNFDSSAQGVLNGLLFRISLLSEMWYPVARRLWNLLLPVYHALE
jgi:signal peptidase I